MSLLGTYLQWAEVLVLKAQYIFPLYLMKNLKFKTLKMPLSLKIQKMAVILHQLTNNEEEQLALQRLVSIFLVLSMLLLYSALFASLLLSLVQESCSLVTD